MADLMQQARAQFEAWATARGKPIHRRDVPSSERHGQYGNVYTQQCWEAWEAAALRAAPEGFVLVRKEAIDWLNGETEEGFECPPDRYFRDEPPRYWWRSVFREKAGLAARPQGVKDV